MESRRVPDRIVISRASNNQRSLGKTIESFRLEPVLHLLVIDHIRNRQTQSTKKIIFVLIFIVDWQRQALVKIDDFEVKSSIPLWIHCFVDCGSTEALVSKVDVAVGIGGSKAESAIQSLKQTDYFSFNDFYFFSGMCPFHVLSLFIPSSPLDSPPNVKQPLGFRCP